MKQEAYTHIQLSAIKAAADRMEDHLGATKEKDKLVVARAVFDLAVEMNVFDAEVIFEAARNRLTPANGWKFS